MNTVIEILAYMEKMAAETGRLPDSITVTRADFEEMCADAAELLVTDPNWRWPFGTVPAQIGSVPIKVVD